MRVQIYYSFKTFMTMTIKGIAFFILLGASQCLLAQDTKTQKITKEEKRVMVLRETEDGKDYTVKFENNEVASIKLNGKEIPKKEFNKHQAVVDRMMKNLPKEFSDAMTGDEGKATGGVKPLTIEREHVIKIAKNQLGQTILTFQPDASEKQFEFVITGAEDIKMNGEAIKEGEIKIKTKEMEYEMTKEKH